MITLDRSMPCCAAGERLAAARGDRCFTSAHLFVAWLRAGDPFVLGLCGQCRVDPNDVLLIAETGLPQHREQSGPQGPQPGDDVIRALSDARQFACSAESPGTAMLVYFLLRQPTGVPARLRELGLRCRVSDLPNGGARSIAASPRSSRSETDAPSCLRDLTRAARNGELSPVIGRENELRTVLAILGQKRVPNVILVGSAGVGKTAIAERLALLVAEGDLPRGSFDTVYELELRVLLGGAEGSEGVESRVRELLKFLKERQNRAILFIDEAHMLFASSGHQGPDLVNRFKSPLARGGLHVVAATTEDEYVRYFERDKALVRRFQRVDIAEPEGDAVCAILDYVREEFESHHNVAIDQDTLCIIGELSRSHQPDRHNPDKAIQLLDLAGSLTSMSGEPAVHRDHVLRAIAERAHIPLPRLTGLDPDDIASLRSALLGAGFSDDSCRRLVDGICAACERPAGDAGPFLSVALVDRTRNRSARDSVGNRLSASLAELLTGRRNRRTHVPLGQCVDRHGVDRLLGAAPGLVGYEEGGQLTEPVRRDPYRVLVVQTATDVHVAAGELVHEVLTTGFLTDSRGRRVDYRQSIVLIESDVTHNCGRLLDACDVRIESSADYSPARL